MSKEVSAEFMSITEPTSCIVSIATLFSWFPNHLTGQQ